MKTLVMLTASILFCSKLFSQTCEVKIMTPDSVLTDAEFFLTIGQDKIVSSSGTLKIDSIKYKKYLDSSYVISFTRPIVVGKLYKDFLPSKKQNRLRDLCGHTFYFERK